MSSEFPYKKVIYIGRTSETSSTNVWYGVDNEIDINSYHVGERADYSFEVGTFKLYTNEIKYNIPPYSFFKDFETGITYLIESEAHAYLTNGMWVHDCKLKDLNAMLESYILGSKSFSQMISPLSDAEMVERIADLIYAKYGFRFYPYQIYQALTEYNEYTFSDGTTLYEALKQFANKNNKRLRCDQVFQIDYFQWVGGVEGWGVFLGNFNVYFDDDIDTTINIPINKVQNISLLQNSENYAKKLECEGVDVVDRDTYNIAYLTPRASNGTLLSEDTAELILPTRVEGIKKLYIEGAGRIQNVYFECDAITQAFINQYLYAGGVMGNFTVSQTLYNWYLTGLTKNGKNIFTELQQMLSAKVPEIAWWNIRFYCENGVVKLGRIEEILNGQTTSTYIDNSELTMDFSAYIFEKNEYNGLTPQEQAKSLVYTSGGNVISNLNGSYKKDFWNAIFGDSVGNIFEERNAYMNTQSDIGSLYGNIAPQTRVFNTLYKVVYVPICNPLLIDEKNINGSAELYNEPTIKNMGRSYQLGDSNGFITDFKLLYKDMDKQNETLGLIECTLEVDETTKFLDSNNTETRLRPNQKITFTYQDTNYEFYISSLTRRFTRTRTFTQLNLAKTKYKVADAIGVDYQYNSTFMPLTNVVDRPIYINAPDNLVYDATLNWQNPYDFLIFDFYYIGGTSIASVCAKPVYFTTDDYLYAYVEAQDNIVWGMATQPIEDESSMLAIENVKYCDGEGYAGKVSIRGFKTTNINSWRYTGSAYSFPKSNGLNSLTEYRVNNNDNRLCSNVVIYKDARERLTFMIRLWKINNNN